MTVGKDNEEVPNLEFITFQNPNVVKSRSTQKVIRSHGIRKSIEERRRKLRRQLENFQHTTPQQIEENAIVKRKSLAAPSLTRVVNVQEIDPFTTLVVDDSKLYALVGHAQTWKAAERVCNLNGRTWYPKFSCIFRGRTGLDDAALLNAMLLATSFAANDYQITPESLTYKSRAICHISHKISAISSVDATIGAILLLIGVEWRLGVKSQAQLHLNGILQMLKRCDSLHIPLCNGITRAIFWQDLFSALVAGTQRVFSIDQFPDIPWERDPSLSFLYTLPPGFESRKDLLGDGLINTLCDIHALQQIREFSDPTVKYTMSIQEQDNQQAWIEEQLFAYLQFARQSDNTILICCILASYICAYCIFSEVWASPFTCYIPAHLSSQLLRQLQNTEDDQLWIGNEDMLLWILMAGATFSQPGVARSEYAILLHGSLRDSFDTFLSSWNETEAILQRFFWSTKWFSSRTSAFWETCCLF